MIIIDWWGLLSRWRLMRFIMRLGNQENSKSNMVLCCFFLRLVKQIIKYGSVLFLLKVVKQIIKYSAVLFLLKLVKQKIKYKNLEKTFVFASFLDRFWSVFLAESKFDILKERRMFRIRKLEKICYFYIARLLGRFASRPSFI